MLRSGALLVAVLMLAFASLAHADDQPLLFPEPQACAAQPDDPTILDKDKARWTDCEKWTWSCLRQGLEANLFAKGSCQVRRSVESNTLRRNYRLAPFYKPERFSESNLLSGAYIETLITNSHYTDQIARFGIRIFGGYFKDPINLENLSTNINLIFDGSMIHRGLRLTNFKTDKNLSFDGSNVRGSMLFMRAKIEGSLFMEAGVYDYVDLNDAKIGASFEASGSVFNDELRIHRADIEGKVILTKARITTLSGWNAQLGSSLEMRLADVRFGVDLTGSHVKGDVRMQDVTFARHESANNARCDWDPELPSHNVLHELKSSVPPEDFDAVFREVVAERPSRAGTVQANVCETAHPVDTSKLNVLSDRNSVLLRDMQIDGALCLVDVTGEIAFKDAPGKRSNIGKIAIDGTETKSTILSWHNTSESHTLWYMVNYKTKYLLANLENSPLVHYTDNIDVGSITMMKRSALYASSTLIDEYRVREKCDVTPGIGNNESISDRDIQDRIIFYFNVDRSLSPQPFANIVSRIEASGVNTTHLKIALSKHANRNACKASQVMREWNELPWEGVGSKLASMPVSEVRYIVSDFFCAAAYGVYNYSTGYGQDFFGLANYFLAGLLLFWLYRNVHRINNLAALNQQTIGGSDVFISYAKLDRALAEGLAAKLRRKGYSVWWDSSLVSGENFRTIILQELAAAKAIIVIWTKNSAKSEWVISEAQRGSSQGKLLPLRTSELDPNDIPPPFDVRHTDVLDNFETIIKALERKKIAPSLNTKPDATAPKTA